MCLCVSGGGGKGASMYVCETYTLIYSRGESAFPSQLLPPRSCRGENFSLHRKARWSVKHIEKGKLKCIEWNVKYVWSRQVQEYVDESARNHEIEIVKYRVYKKVLKKWRVYSMGQRKSAEQEYEYENVYTRLNSLDCFRRELDFENCSAWVRDERWGGREPTELVEGKRCIATFYFSCQVICGRYEWQRTSSSAREVYVRLRSYLRQFV